MQMINLPQLRLAQLQTLTEGIIEIVKNLGEVAPQVQGVNAAFTNFQEGMTKNASASNKKTLDRTRDQLNSGFFKTVESEALYPHDANAQTAVAKILDITNKYDYDLNYLSYDEQTAETDNMLRELEDTDINLLPGIQHWIAPIKSANDNFKTSVKSYLEEQVQAGDVDTASTAAIPLENALNELFTILFAHIHITKSEPLIEAHKELSTLVNSYK